MPLPIKNINKRNYWITSYNDSTKGGYFVHKKFNSVCDVDCYTIGKNKEPSKINQRWNGGDKKYWGYIDEEGIEWEVKFQ